ncbi:TlpA disulfide reductase family protein [Luteimonas terricola]|uniref:Thiol:disulfide interchange protein n=1 Tax=Luteimonas terricola TaxID=645597 RepID=A0ABQ2E4V2_9GAMM|nr:TlpA disulfide reductase family protein [Luteimonas terricola]GGJ95931.1 thiol:disulfide interchange protein [Luteimonas terricola]
MRTVIVALAALLAWLVVRAWARRLPDSPHAPELRHKVAGAWFIDALFVGLLAARIGYVLRWWPDYAAAPKSIIAIGDGGFLWWSGLPAAIAFAWWRSRSARALRRPLLAGIAAGMLAWLAFSGTLALLRNSAPPLPDFELATLDGTPTTLAAHAGQPVVLNMWATWCPPCRREMPVLEDAQGRYPGVAIVLVNQGEDRGAIRDYLDQQGLAFEHMLLDPHSRTMLDTNTRGLPTTLFFDADGRLVDTHMGELTRASLADTLRRRFGEVAHGRP